MESEDLIPGLPAEIARGCLLRVPYQYHRSLRSVCRSWKTLVKSPSFYRERKIAGRAEQSICMVQALVPDGLHKPRYQPVYGLTVYNTLQNSWKRLGDIPQFPKRVPLFSQCVSVNEKLFVIGGWDPVSLEAISRVSIYDFCCNRWSRGADMSTARSFFACAAYGGKIFVSGGHDDGKNALKSGEVYSVDEDTWERIPDMSRERDEPQGAFVDGKFFVISGYSTESQGQFDNSAEVFDPVNNRWTRLDNMWAFAESPRSCASAFGKLLSSRRRQVMEYHAKENAWSVVCDVPGSITGSPCAIQLNDTKLFISGSSCSRGEQVAFLLEPATAGNGNIYEGRTCATWTAVNIPPKFPGFVYSLCTLEI